MSIISEGLNHDSVDLNITAGNWEVWSWFPGGLVCVTLLGTFWAIIVVKYLVLDGMVPKVAKLGSWFVILFKLYFLSYSMSLERTREFPKVLICCILFHLMICSF